MEERRLYNDGLCVCKSICIREPEINERRPAIVDEFPISKLRISHAESR